MIWRANKLRLGNVKIGTVSLGLALGAGGAKGWAHLGVFRALEEEGIPIEVVSGTSIGALMGAFYCAGSYNTMWEFAREHRSLRQTLSLLDLRMKTGVVGGSRLMRFLEKKLPEREFSELQLPFGAVATNLRTMEEVHITHGALLPAIRASISIPGFLSPYLSGKDVFVDGGMLNPVPVSLAKEMGADAVIAVDLRSRRNERKMDTFAGVLNRSADTMMNRIRQINYRLFPAEVVIRPELRDYGMIDYHRTVEAIQAGYSATKEAMPQIHALLEKKIHIRHTYRINTTYVGSLSRDHAFSQKSLEQVPLKKIEEVSG